MNFNNKNIEVSPKCWNSKNSISTLVSSLWSNSIWIYVWSIRSQVRISFNMTIKYSSIKDYEY